MPSHGLLNIIAAPQLGEQSTYAAVYSSAGGHLVLPDSSAMVEAFAHYVHSSQYPVLVSSTATCAGMACRGPPQAVT